MDRFIDRGWGNRAGMAIVIALLLASIHASAFADTLVLLDGTQLEGSLTNRDHVQQNASSYTQISFLVGDGPDATLRRFNVADIKYIVLDGPAGHALIDFTASQRSNDTKRSEHYFTLKGGVTWARFHGDDASGLDSRRGFLLGGNWTTFQNKNLGFRLGVGYTQKGMRGEMTESGQTAEIEFSFNYIDVPLLLVGRHPTNRVDYLGFIGPCLSFLVNAHSQGNGWTEVGLPVLDQEVDLTDGSSSIDFGITVGVGMDIRLNKGSSLVLEASWNRGLRTFDETPVNADWKHGVMAVSAGIALWATPRSTP